MLIFQEKGNDDDDESHGEHDERDYEIENWSESDDVIPPSITVII